MSSRPHEVLGEPAAASAGASPEMGSGGGETSSGGGASPAIVVTPSSVLEPLPPRRGGDAPFLSSSGPASTASSRLSPAVPLRPIASGDESSGTAPGRRRRRISLDDRIANAAAAAASPEKGQRLSPSPMSSSGTDDLLASPQPRSRVSSHTSRTSSDKDKRENPIALSLSPKFIEPIDVPATSPLPSSVENSSVDDEDVGGGGGRMKHSVSFEGDLNLAAIERKVERRRRRMMSPSGTDAEVDSAIDRVLDDTTWRRPEPGVTSPPLSNASAAMFVPVAMMSSDEEASVNPEAAALRKFESNLLLPRRPESRQRRHDKQLLMRAANIRNVLRAEAARAEDRQQQQIATLLSQSMPKAAKTDAAASRSSRSKRSARSSRDTVTSLDAGAVRPRTRSRTLVVDDLGSVGEEERHGRRRRTGSVDSPVTERAYRRIASASDVKSRPLARATGNSRSMGNMRDPRRSTTTDVSDAAPSGRRNRVSSSEGVLSPTSVYSGGSSLGGAALPETARTDGLVRNKSTSSSATTHSKSERRSARTTQAFTGDFAPAASSKRAPPIAPGSRRPGRGRRSAKVGVAPATKGHGRDEQGGGLTDLALVVEDAVEAETGQAPGWAGARDDRAPLQEKRSLPKSYDRRFGRPVSTTWLAAIKYYTADEKIVNEAPIFYFHFSTLRDRVRALVKMQSALVFRAMALAIALAGWLRLITMLPLSEIVVGTCDPLYYSAAAVASLSSMTLVASAVVLPYVTAVSLVGFNAVNGLALRYMLPASIALSSTPAIMEAAGVHAWTYLVDTLLLAVSTLVGFLVFGVWASRRTHDPRIVRVLVVPMVLMGALYAAYLHLVPVFFAPDRTQVERIFFIILHLVLADAALLFVRFVLIKKALWAENDPHTTHWMFYMLQALMALHGRIYVSSMDSAGTVALAATVYSLVSLLLRTTALQRDRIVYRIVYRKSRIVSLVRLRRRNVAWMLPDAQHVQAQVEIVAALVGPLMLCFAHGDRLVLGGWMVPNSDPPCNTLVALVLFQWLLEAAVGFAALATSAARQRVPVLEAWEERTGNWVFMSASLLAIMGVLAVYFQRTVPSILCDDMDDPCSCSFAAAHWAE